MRYFRNGVSTRLAGPIFSSLAMVSIFGLVTGAHAQSFCSSDGQLRPVVLLERFINADCEACWNDPATPAADSRQIALDWVIPGSKGEDAPLSPVANRDGLQRLQALVMPVPSTSVASTHNVTGLKGVSLRVAHGLTLGGYVGVSIGLKPANKLASRQPLTAWLALVESIPEGTEGTPIPRNLIRNVLQLNWKGVNKLSKKEHAGLIETRVMSVAAGVNPDNLQVIGWVEDSKGTVLAAAQSRCK